MKLASVIFALIMLWLTPLSAQVTRVTLKVDGLACAFCAYGLQKGLKRIEGVQDVKVYVDAGRAELLIKQAVPVALEDIEPAVKNAGYTPREITVEASGRLVDWNGQPALTVERTGEGFLLNGTDAVTKLRAALGVKGKGATVTVIGRLEKVTPPAHHGHPVTLRLERFTMNP